MITPLILLVSSSKKLYYIYTYIFFFNIFFNFRVVSSLTDFPFFV